MNIQKPNRLWLPRTGQTASAVVGDDGYFRAGNPRATRMVDNGDGTLSARDTGLMWVKDPSQLGGAFGTPGSPAAMTWPNGVANCLGTRWNPTTGLSYAGHDDWRLPNVMELLSLYNFGVATGPAISPLFANIPAAATSYYWTSTAWGYDSTLAHYTIFRPISFWVRVASKATAYLVLPVRGGRINANG